VSVLSDENPYSPPLSSDPPVQRMRTYAGPIWRGLVAIVLVTIVSRGGLFIPAIFGVGSWWIYKFRPRKPASDDVGAREFLERLEDSRTKKDDVQKASERVSHQQPLDVFREIRL
jgi:hypothetical protein